ncbi:MAG: sugar phosphate isomerase/epimerase family protein [Bryobacteraceae bacterium]
MSSLFRQAICNEVFKDWQFEDACKAIRAAGYTGIEIAPFTLAEDPATITPAERKEFKRMMAAEGLTFVGLHWLMASPKGLHVTTPDRAVRERSWLHVRNLVDLSADLGPDSIMVFGSPFQRASTGGMSREEATRHYVDGLAAVAPHAESRGVTILMEALPAGQCDVVQTLDEAASLVREIGSPALRTMYDSHNAVDEVEPHEILVDRHYDLIRHIHVNEMDGKHPTPGGFDFKPVFATLKRRGYPGWISLEAFDFTPGAERIANESLHYLESEIAKLDS